MRILETMRLSRRIVALAALLAASGCRKTYVVPVMPMPPNTILLSQMMRELSAKPGFTEALIHQLDHGGKKGPALLTPALIEELRKRILGEDWEGLDRFPGWTMREVNPTVRVAGHFAGKNPKLEGMAAVHPGSPAASMSEEQARQFLDLGPYALNKEATVSLSEPSTFPAFNLAASQTQLGGGVVRGDGPNALAPMQPESQRLADVLNRLAANKLDGSAKFSAAVMSAKPGTWERSLEGRAIVTPEDLIAALITSGHTVNVTDSRYFANFGHLHYKGEDVMMPFWLDTQIAVPNTGNWFSRPRPLLVPVSHAEYEWHIRGPHVNADVSYYFGIDGKSEWRTMDTLDQAWVLKRDAHTYTGEQAIEVTRLVGLLTVMYMHQHAARPELSFGGYYALGVCQDGVSAIEHRMTGRSTLFPNTADSSLFDDPRDAEVNALITAIPKDRVGEKPEPDRVFGSLPTTTFNDITIPGLADDLNATYAAWQAGKLQRTHGALFYAATQTLVALAAAALVFGVVAARRQRR